MAALHSCEGWRREAARVIPGYMSVTAAPFRGEELLRCIQSCLRTTQKVSNTLLLFVREVLKLFAAGSGHHINQSKKCGTRR